jgi:DNA-directed RNA polymerase specialized sigma24 family protein
MPDANQAVADYQACTDAEERQRRAEELFMRHLPLARRTLARFCPGSRCYAGACVVEDLVGEVYPLFRDALDAYESRAGIDFLGYTSVRLYWGLEHRARWLRRARTSVMQCPAGPPSLAGDGDENRLLDRVLVEQLLGTLDAADGEVLVRHAAGETCQELAGRAGVSPAAMRKRLERARAKARAVCGEEREGT